MPNVTVLLLCNGNCREVMGFYQRCFGGELVFRTVEDVALMEGMSSEMRGSVVQAELRFGGVVLRGTDLVDEAVMRGGDISVFLEFDSSEELRKCCSMLVEGACEKVDVGTDVWGGTYASLTDRFGRKWVLMFSNT